MVVSRLSRSKRKFLTLVSGLDLFGVVTKEAISIFKKKFACGVSQVKGIPSSVLFFLFIFSRLPSWLSLFQLCPVLIIFVIIFFSFLCFLQGCEDIEIQGDVSFEVVEFITETWPQIKQSSISFGEDARAAKK